jgi:hypothetical protein
MAGSKGAVQVATSDTGNRIAIGWILSTVLAVSLTSGCSGTPPAMRQETTTVSTDLYQVGPLRVLLRPQPEVEFMCRLHAQQQAAPNGRILGCYVPREKAIISTPDAHVLLHEFKHYFEGPFHE